jgi:hypothetical protein
MSTFISVPASDLHNFLTSKGFTPSSTGAGRERIYRRIGKANAALSIAVYSSVSEGSTQARGVGEDAIRVVLLGRTGTGREWGLHKCKRIHRTKSVEAVLARILDRIMEAAEASKRYGSPCPKCGTPTYADSGRCIDRACRETPVATDRSRAFNQAWAGASR